MIQELKTIASNLREKIEEQLQNFAGYIEPELRNFPGGSCEIASALLGLHLVDLGYSDLLMQKGERPIPGDINPQNHCWLVLKNQIIIDITADQFDDCDDKVIVTLQSNFHNTFNKNYNKQITYNCLSRPGSEGYSEFYQSLIQI